MCTFLSHFICIQIFPKIKSWLNVKNVSDWNQQHWPFADLQRSTLSVCIMNATQRTCVYTVIIHCTVIRYTVIHYNVLRQGVYIINETPRMYVCIHCDYTLCSYTLYRYTLWLYTVQLYTVQLYTVQLYTIQVYTIQLYTIHCTVIYYTL